MLHRLIGSDLEGAVAKAADADTSTLYHYIHKTGGWVQSARIISFLFALTFKSCRPLMEDSQHTQK